MTLDGRLDTTETRDGLGFEFTVTNSGADPVDLEFRSGLQADFAVLDDGAEIWRWSEGKAFTQMLETKTLAPGESVSYSRTWTDPVPGAFTAVATLEASGVSVQASAAVEI